MKRIVILIYIAAVALSLFAAEKPTHSEATLEVKYKYEYAMSHIDSLKYKTDDMLLQIASDESRFFSLKTEFYDSLAAAPGGAELIRDMQMDALNKSGAIKRDASGNITSITVDSKAFENVPRRGIRFNVYKYPLQNNMKVFDCLGNDDTVNTWDLPMDEIVWEPGDSTTFILGYECQNATAVYHGRRWIAWFAPDVPVGEGPWQLCGLPGIILMAEADGAEYRFTATSINECKEVIKDMPGEHMIEKCSRKDFRRQEADIAKNPGKIYGISSSVKNDLFHDLIETDYND